MEHVVRLFQRIPRGSPAARTYATVARSATRLVNLPQSSRIVQLSGYAGKKIGIANHDQTTMNAIDVIDTGQPPNSMAFRLSLRASPIGSIIFDPV